MLTQIQTYARSIVFIAGGTKSHIQLPQNSRGREINLQLKKRVGSVIAKCFLHYSTFYFSPCKRKYRSTCGKIEKSRLTIHSYPCSPTSRPADSLEGYFSLMCISILSLVQKQLTTTRKHQCCLSQQFSISQREKNFQCLL